MLTIRSSIGLKTLILFVRKDSRLQLVQVIYYG